MFRVRSLVHEGPAGPNLVALGASVLWLVSARTPGPVTETRVLVYGVDGATFDVIDAHIGELPNFERLAREGARATLTSMEPMFSPPLWTTIASGRPASEHGVLGFRVHSDDCKVARFWDVAEHAGMGSGSTSGWWTIRRARSRTVGSGCPLDSRPTSRPGPRSCRSSRRSSCRAGSGDARWPLRTARR